MSDRTYDVALTHPTGPSIGGLEDVCEATVTIAVNGDGNAEDLPRFCPTCGAALSTEQQAALAADAEQQWADHRDWERYGG